MKRLLLVASIFVVSATNAQSLQTVVWDFDSDVNGWVVGGTLGGSLALNANDGDPTAGSLQLTSVVGKAA